MKHKRSISLHYLALAAEGSLLIIFEVEFLLPGMVGSEITGKSGSPRLIKFDSFSVGIVASTLIFWGALASMVVFSSPQAAGFWGLAIFYVSLILGLTGIFYLAGIYLRKKILKADGGLNDYNALRQSLLISLFLAGLLGLVKLQIFNILTVALILGALAFFELFLRENKNVDGGNRTVE